MTPGSNAGTAMPSPGTGLATRYTSAPTAAFDPLPIAGEQ